MSASSESEREAARERENNFRPSRYNFFIPDADDALLFNGLTSALMRLPRGIYSAVRGIFSTKNLRASALPTALRPLFDMLVSGGFLVGVGVDEISVVRNRLERARAGGDLHIVIAPTLECNLACGYCYQFRSPGIMNAEICGSIIKFVGRKLAEKTASAIRVDWYGGEPLLAPDVISHLSVRLMKLAQKHNCEYESSIATNGTLAPAADVGFFKKNKIKSCQITLDGPKEIHDRRRRYKSGSGSTFDIALKNIKRLVGKIEISVRINVDASNLSGAYFLLEMFKKERLFDRAQEAGFFPYVAMVNRINPCKNLACEPLDTGKFYKHSIDFQKKTFEYSDKRHLSPLLDFPFPVNAACGALRENTYAFDPQGYIFRCALEIGEPGKHCGHVSRGLDEDLQKKWDDYDPLDDKKCRECNYLSFCMGNCPKGRLDRNPYYESDSCIYWKEKLGGIIKTYVAAMEEIRAVETKKIAHNRSVAECA